MDYSDYLLKTFTDRSYRHTAMVTHKGTVVAFAMDDQRRIHYSVLNLAQSAEARGELDVNYWEEPRLMTFPREVSQVGFGLIAPTAMPVVKKDSGGAEADPGSLRPEEIDPFYSTTARLSADAPFQALSDGKFIYLFRQSVGADDEAAVYKTIDGGASAFGRRPLTDYATNADGAKAPVVRNTLLVDRFVLSGPALLPKMEVRYRRSRIKARPQGAKDSLDDKDMNDQPFYEPTHELGFVRNLKEGRFSVVLLPTQTSEVQQWQVFAHNSASGRIDSFNVERSVDGLFNTQGTTFYTSPDPQYRSSVFEREAGACPFTGEPLIPLRETSGYAETALVFDGVQTKAEVIGYKGIAGTGARTVEAWIKTDGVNMPIASWGSTDLGRKCTFIVQSANGVQGAIRVEVAGGYIVGSTPVNDGQWHHVAFTFDPEDGTNVNNMRLYVDGALEQSSASLAKNIDTAGGVDFLIGADQMNRRFGGSIDEVRIWDRALSQAEIQSDRNLRLVGDEPGLAGYWRFDEGSGAVAYDQSGNGRDATIFQQNKSIAAPQFDGATSYMKAPCPELFKDLAEHDFTIELRIKLNQWKQWSRAVSVQGIATQGVQIIQIANVYMFGVRLGDTLYILKTCQVELGAWYHLACIWNGREKRIELYMNGVSQQNEDNLDFFHSSDIGMNIGRRDTFGGSYFPGSVCDFRIWNYVLPEDTIRARMKRMLTGNETGLVGFWPMNEGAGASLADHGEYALNGAINGEAVWIEELPDLAVPVSAETPTDPVSVPAFNGKDNYVRISAGTPWETKQFTVELWVKARRTDQEKWTAIIASAEGGLANTVQISFDENGYYVFHHMSFNHRIGLVKTRWQHLAVTYDGRDLTFFLDGNETYWKAPIDLTAAFHNFNIGCNRGRSCFFDGRIAEVRIWDHRRSKADLLAAMHSRLAGNETGLVGYWPLNDGSGDIVADSSVNGRSGAMQGAAHWVMDEPPATNSLIILARQPDAWLGLSSPAWSASDAPIGERPGFHRSGFSIMDRTIASGLTSVLYHQQEPALAGYDQQSKPLKKNARVMLALSTGNASDSLDAKLVATLDFAVSRQGRLPQIPDVIDLGSALNSSVNQDLARLQQLEQQIKSGNSATDIKAEAEQLREKLSDEVVLPMNLLHTDEFGLTLSGGLLGFAYSGDSPYLFDSATGQLALYFRGSTGQFFAAYYDTNTRRAQLRLPAGEGELAFVARSAEPEADQSRVAISDGPAAEYCTVKIENPAAGIVETWNRAPRQGPAFAAVLNGLAHTPVFLGVLAEAAAGSVTQLMLAGKVDRPLATGDTVRIGEAKAIISQPVARGDTVVNIDVTVLSADSGAAVSLMPYDYAEHAGTNRSTDRLQRGSLFFGVAPLGNRALAENGAVASDSSTLSCHWRAQSPGNALFFQGGGYLAGSSETAALAKLDAMGDLSLEAWVNPNAVDQITKVIHHCSGNSQFTLGLNNGSLGNSALVMNGETDYIQMSGSLLNNLAQFTLEGWICPAANNMRALFGQYDLIYCCFYDNGTIALNIGGGGGLANVAYPFPMNEWHHLAITGDGKKLKLYLDGNLQQPGYENSPIKSNYGASSYRTAIGSKDLWGGCNHFLGKMDEVRYWRVARSQSDIREAMNRRLSGAESGLIGYWRFDRVQNGQVLDSSGNGRHGQIYGAPGIGPSPLKTNVFFAGVGNQFRQSIQPIQADTWQHLAAVYRQSYALAFDGKDDHLSAEHSQTLNLHRDLTLEVFFMTNDLKTDQGLVSKGRLKDGAAEAAVPYALWLAEGGVLKFAYEDKSGAIYEFQANRKLASGTFYRVAVTRRHETLVENRGSDASPDVRVNHEVTVNFYIDKTEAGNSLRLAPAPGVNGQALDIGRMAISDKIHYLNGIVSELRLWNTCLALEQVGRRVGGDEEGLIAWWRCEENDGARVADAKGENHAAVQGARWVKNPDPEGSWLSLYYNGTPVDAMPMTPAPNWYESTPQFTLGAARSGANIQYPFHGAMEEIRIWKTPRSQEQILDNLFTRLKGEKEDLIANYSFDEGAANQVLDQGLRGNHLTLGGTAAPVWTLSTAPISTDIAPVRSALAGIKTSFHDSIGGTPAVQEYADMQVDSLGNLTGVMKRCYGYVKDGAWRLMTGYKVGNLTTEWVGQVQADPQIIGFIEGAPPVPGENMTSTSAKLGEYEDYNGSSVIELVEPKTVNHIFASSAESGFDMAFDLSVKFGMQSNSQAGFGLITEIEDTRARIGSHSTFEASQSSVREAESSFGRNITKTTRMELHGYWEEPENQGGAYLNPAIGRRYIPENNGLALVQSDTMDVFALRLAHNNSLVGYRMRPNPDIPKDWNIIMFPINPRYIKQGTLDGRVGATETGGVQTDPDYPQAANYGEYSFFKPREAYALKKRIEREQQELATYYRQYDTSQSIGNHDTQASVPGRVAARNLANTYVWTAEGGFFAETSEVMEATSESTSGSYSFSGMTGLQVEFNLSIFKVSAQFELEAMFGGHLETTKTRASESEESFSLAIEVAPDSDLQLHVNTPAEAEKYAGHIDEESLAAWHPDGSPVLRPGRVDAYRFMTFYLEPAKENFEDFFSKVVDPIWLSQSADPDAVALRQAQQVEKKPRCWRILHRVTFVSRILPEIEPDTQLVTVEQAMQTANVQSNWELIKKLEPFVRTKTESHPVFAKAVEETLAIYLPELLPHAEDVTAYAALYFDVKTDV